MKKAMLSQPMRGKTEAEIKATREHAIRALKAKGYEVVNTLFTDEWYSDAQMKQRGVENIPLCFWQNLLKICRFVMQHFLRRLGKCARLQDRARSSRSLWARHNI